MAHWKLSGKALPDEPVFAALVQDLQAGAKAREIGKAGTRLNYEKSGLRGMITRSGKKSLKVKEGPYKEKVEINLEVVEHQSSKYIEFSLGEYLVCIKWLINVW